MSLLFLLLFFDVVGKLAMFCLTVLLVLIIIAGTLVLLMLLIRLVAEVVSDIID